ncbi:polyketide synthase [Ktedonobacteria bacterium brp13]|nr:polyketide synthase [Ktedonobacteria bacterium brp13]
MSGKEPIAIIGMGCRFPAANNLREFWQLLSKGKDAITNIPPERFDIDALYDPRPGSAGKLVSRCGGFIDAIDQFDPAFFGISPREASKMDPQQRLLLEVAWEALEDAGIPVPHLAGSATGVFVGMATNDYEDLAFQHQENVDLYMMTGCSRAVAAGRLSYVLDLQGPSMSVDAACASSLVAVHLASQSIWSGECSLALAAGANLILEAEQGLGFSKMGLLSPEGRCKTFDAQANGFVRSEGIGVVVLKPYAQALADGDPIYCLLRGSAVNNDGRTSGLLVTPGEKSQEAVLRKAYLDAGIAPSQVQYVEAHGTGTLVGDHVEVTAIGEVYGKEHTADNPCWIGSVKSNIGHTEGAAGIAGFIKVALALKHGAIPPNLHLHEPHPQLPLKYFNLKVPQQLESWKQDGHPVLAAVSCFGISATNAHVVLEQVHTPLRSLPLSTDTISSTQLVTLSAQTPEALNALVQSYRDTLPDLIASKQITLADISYSASCRRTHHEQRLALVADSKESIDEQLAAFLQHEERSGMSHGSKMSAAAKVVYVFPGQGSQWLGMGCRLLEQEPVFRAKLQECDKLIRQYTNWSLLDVLTERSAHTFEQIDMLQPVLLAMELGLAALWASWGVRPDAVVGHSMGELAAAVLAGALSLEDALHVICWRSHLLKRISGSGSMAVVNLPLEQAQTLISDYEERVSIASNNSPTETVLSGDSATIDQFMRTVKERGIYCSLIKVDVASHSAQVDPLLNDLRHGLTTLQPRSTSIPFYSTVTSTPLAGAELDAAYWTDNLRQPVLFYPTVTRLLQDGYSIFVEMTPHPILLGSLQQTFKNIRQQNAKDGTYATPHMHAIPSLRRDMDERSSLLASVGTLYTLGLPLQWEHFYSGSEQYVSLPSYPWQNERFWLPEYVDIPGDSTHGKQSVGGGQPSWSQRQLASKGAAVNGEHPILGAFLTSAARPGEYIWEFELSQQRLPYLAEHRVEGRAVVPATAYLELAQDATREIFAQPIVIQEQITFQKALFLPEEGGVRVQLLIAPAMPGSVTYAFFSQSMSDKSNNATGTRSVEQWEQHARGTLLLNQELQESETTQRDAATNRTLITQLQENIPQVRTGEQHYQRMREHGLDYGASFQGVKQCWKRAHEVLCQIRITPEIKHNIDDYQFHPALLDACLQTVVAALSQDTNGEDTQRGPLIPISIEHLALYQHAYTDLWSRVWIQEEERQVQEKMAATQTYRLAWEVYDEAGQLMLEASGIRIQHLVSAKPAVSEENMHDWLYEMHWEALQTANILSPKQQTAYSDEQGGWLIFADQSGIGQQVAEQLQNAGHTIALVYIGQDYREYQEYQKPAHYYIDPAQPEHFQRLLQTICHRELPHCRGILNFWSLEPTATPSLASLEDASIRGCGATLHLLQALEKISWQQVPRLWLITNGTQDIEQEQESSQINVAQAALWGLGRVIIYEHPELHCTRVDLSSQPQPAEMQSLYQLIVCNDAEDQSALRGDQRYVARLLHMAPETMSIDASTHRAFEQADTLLAQEIPLRIKIPETGNLEHLELVEIERPRPGRGEVEIQVSHAGLNFKDVLYALGMLNYENGDENHFGHECAGRIVAVGEDVTDFQIDDEVITTNPLSCFRHYVIKPAAMVLARPHNLSLQEAATIPIVFLTADYALNYIGHLEAGERVLIHAAAGGVGLAAVQIAQRCGAEIFATAGSPEKREYLRSLGVKHVFDSRSLAFADQIMQITGGQGVEVVLNSLAGEALTRSFNLLANHGRFLELGKRDIQQSNALSLASFEKDLTFAAIDISLLIRERPTLMMRLLRNLLQQFECGQLHLLPITAFPLSATIEAFHHLAQAKQIGKVVLTFHEQIGGHTLNAEQQSLGQEHRTELAATSSFSADKTYLLTGGLGGLGLTIVRWMIEQGARHIVLVGRSGPSQATQQLLDELRQQDVEIIVEQVDITQREQVAWLIRRIQSEMPPLRGIMHAAAILKDRILLQTSLESLQDVMAPKVKGAWNLHELTSEIPLDFFVLFSSTASLIGLPGQGNYSAANAFLDALAHLRHTQGQPGLSINWGAWSDVGLAAAQANRGQRLALRGIKNLPPAQGLQALEILLRQSTKAQIGVMPFDFEQWRQFYPSINQSTMFSTLHTNQEASIHNTATEQAQQKMSYAHLLTQSANTREKLIEDYLKEHTARILRLPVNRLDEHKPIHALGIDSLMAVELKNQIEADIEINIPVVVLLQGITILQLVSYILGEIEASTGDKDRALSLK